MLYGWISFNNLKSVQYSLNYVKVLMGVAFKILYSVRMYKKPNSQIIGCFKFIYLLWRQVEHKY